MEEKKCTQDSIKRRLRRIEGQLKGIQRMLDKDACCVDVLIQISAVRAAIAKVGAMIIENHMKECLELSVRGDNEEETIENLMKIMSSYIK